MSRSRKFPVEKDRNGKHHNCFNRRYRSRTKQITRVFAKSISVRNSWVTFWMYEQGIDESTYPHRYEIMCAFTYCDYWVCPYLWYGANQDLDDIEYDLKVMSRK